MKKVVLNFWSSWFDYNPDSTLVKIDDYIWKLFKCQAQAQKQ